MTLAGTDVMGVNFGWVDTGALGSFTGTIDDGDGDPDRHTDTVVDVDILDYDFGYSQGSIGDLVWVDNDRDGIFEPSLGEVGVEGVVLELFDGSGGAAGTTATGARGLYLFDSLPPDVYTVIVAARCSAISRSPTRTVLSMTRPSTRWRRPRTSWTPTSATC